jgi:hypothetical protein
MAGLDPAIHVYATSPLSVDARIKSGHDAEKVYWCKYSSAIALSGHGAELA